MQAHNSPLVIGTVWKERTAGGPVGGTLVCPDGGERPPALLTAART